MKLKAFTLVEMLVVLMTAMLLLSLLALFYRFVSREYHVAVTGEERRDDMLSLYLLLQGDLWRSDTLYLMPSGMVMTGRDTVRYHADTTGVTREKAGLAERLPVVIRDIVYDAGQLRVSVQGRSGDFIEIVVEQALSRVSW
ncbi:MAG: hypothetical protein LBP56_01200 [Odoribacteraceae bacterium]|nr:hypothetical protein [Odoribacteraceae bacterium]